MSIPPGVVGSGGSVISPPQNAVTTASSSPPQQINPIQPDQLSSSKPQPTGQTFATLSFSKAREPLFHDLGRAQAIKYPEGQIG